jgi:hypothetical protein
MMTDWARYSNPARPDRFHVGAIVKYSGKWLRNTGQVTGQAGQRKGVVIDPSTSYRSEWLTPDEPDIPGLTLSHADFVLVRWGDGQITPVRKDNLMVPGKPQARDFP